MKSKILLFVFVLFATNTVVGQIMFERTYGGAADDGGGCVQQLNDGGYIIVGTTTSFGAGGRDIYLIRTDEFGDTLWTKTYGGTNDDEAFSIQTTIDSGFIITGYTSSYGFGNMDVYLLKINQNGDTIWTKTFGGNQNDLGFCIEITDDNGFVIVGETASFGSHNSSGYLIRTNANGDTLWTKNIGTRDYNNIKSISRNTDNSYIITGSAKNIGMNWDIYLAKLDDSGNLLWQKYFGGTGNDYGFSVLQTNDYGFILTGSYINTSGNSDIIVIKTDSNGDTIWTKLYGGSGDDLGFSIKQTSDNGYIIAGVTESSLKIDNKFWMSFINQNILINDENLKWNNGNIFVIKINISGDTLWTSKYGGSGDDWANYICETSDGGYIIIGTSKSFGSNCQVYVIKTNNTGFVGLPPRTDNNLLNLFPNPSDGIINFQIHTELFDVVSIEVYNCQSQLVLFVGNYVLSSLSKLDLTKLRRGTYLLKISGKNIQLIEKIIII